MKTNRTSRLDLRGFSLVELLLVLVIFAILLGLTVASFQNVGPSLSLTRGGDELVGAILRARQRAITTSDAVEVRFYNLASEEDDDYVTVYQIVTQESDGSYRAESPIRFPVGIGISRDPQLSSFFDVEEDALTALLIRGIAGEQFPLEEEAEFVAFRYLPDGSTNLPEEKWFVTVTFQDELEDEEVPTNFYTIQIDPVLGQIQTFRP